MVDSRGDVLAILIYDSALVSKLQEQMSQVAHLFSRRGAHPLFTNRLAAVVAYYALCRLSHRSGLTVGEELSSGSSKRGLTLRLRLAWFLASVSFPIVREAVIPYVRSRWRKFGLILELLGTLSSDAFFLLSSRATSSSLIEQVLIPDSCMLRRDIKPTFDISPRLLGLAGWVVVMQCARKVGFLVSEYRTSQKCLDKPILSPPPEMPAGRLAGLEASPGECPVCMCCIERPTATVCGHIFCWECIFEWTSEQGSPCPVCRTESVPQDLLPLSNYAPNESEWKPFWSRPLILHPS